MGSISKAVRRVIPKEIQPILPIAASMFGGPMIGSALGLGAKTGILSGITNPILQRAIGSGITSAGVDLLTRGKVDPRTLAVSALMGGGGQYLKGDPTMIGPKTGFQNLKSEIGQALAPDVSNMTKLSDLTNPVTVATTTGGAISAYDAAEEAQRKYEEEMAGREADAAADRQSRINYITRYMNMAGFSQAEIDDALSRYGYKTGGRVGFAEGGSSLYDKAKDMNRLAMEIKLIDLGYGGFGGKDLEGMSDEEIMKLYKEATSKANGGLMGTRVGYKIGGSTMQNVMARLLNIEVPAERLEEMRQNRADFLFNENVDAEDYPSQDYLNKVREAAEKQATKELEEYMKKIGMDPLNPPEGSMSDKLIDQIMEPRKEGRVKEDGENQTPGQEVLKQLKDFDVLPPMDDMGYMDETMQRLLKSRSGKAKGGRIEYAEGGIMNLKMGGMPAEMDLRGGGFVPIGAKEKADDVPARLSKNEFVMTADAVRAAGGGSVNKGAKRMYDLMHKLEARV